jgi:hypothetical protein
MMEIVLITGAVVIVVVLVAWSRLAELTKGIHGWPRDWDRK